MVGTAWNSGGLDCRKPEPTILNQLGAYNIIFTIGTKKFSWMSQNMFQLHSLLFQPFQTTGGSHSHFGYFGPPGVPGVPRQLGPGTVVPRNSWAPEQFVLQGRQLGPGQDKILFSRNAKTPGDQHTSWSPGRHRSESHTNLIFYQKSI